MAGSSHHVQFLDGIKAEERPKPKQQPTQKYDRKEIQKRLDIENWIEEQLTDLYEVRENTHRLQLRDRKEVWIETDG